MSQLNLDSVSKKELLQALIYMASEYITSDETTHVEHQFMQAGEYTCEVLTKVGVLAPLDSGGTWLIDPWVNL
jgi:hypothetical protein